MKRSCCRPCTLKQHSTGSPYTCRVAEVSGQVTQVCFSFKGSTEADEMLHKIRRAPPAGAGPVCTLRTHWCPRINPVLEQLHNALSCCTSKAAQRVREEEVHRSIVASAGTHVLLLLRRLQHLQTHDLQRRRGQAAPAEERASWMIHAAVLLGCVKRAQSARTYCAQQQGLSKLLRRGVQ